MTIITNSSSPVSMFVTSDEQIFVDNVFKNKRVDRWASNGTRLSSPMSICSLCSGLFIDTNNNLYCSQYYQHQVVRKQLNNQANTFTIVAGIGCMGSTPNSLRSPMGIFVTANFDLYVADCGNHRVQLFRSGETDAITVAGDGAPGTIQLKCPSGVAADGDGYLFIVDHYHHRIVRAGPHGFQCAVGCSGSTGAATHQLSKPTSLSFDRHGNLFITDRSNNRIQKFFVLDNSCSK